MVEKEVPGVAIGLVDGQKVVWAKGFGFSNLTARTPVTADTIFSLQSISKTYSATAFMRAVDRKLIDLDDRLVDEMPKFSIHDRFGGSQVKRITMRHLLSHWSGICQEAPIGNNYGEWHCSFKQHVLSIQDSWLRAPVGTRYRYSNPGFDLAGYALSLRLRKPFEDVMQSELLTPLGMTDSTYRRSEIEKSPRLATGYLDLKSPVPPLEIPMVAAGGLFSTVNDMTKYVRFQLADGKISGKQWISKEALATMRTPQFNGGRRERGYGIGIQSRPYHGGRLCTHGGGGYGFGTIQSWMPDYQLGVVILTNGDQGGDLSEEIADLALTGMIRGKKGNLPDEGPYVRDPRPTVILSPAKLHRLEGVYKATSGLAEFKVEDGQLHYHRQRSNVALFARSGSESTDEKQTQSFRFDLSSDGWAKGVLQLGNVGPDYMVLNERLGEVKGPDQTQWKEFVGEYKATAYGQATTQKVILRNGYLFWGDTIKLLPYRDGLFFTVDGEAVAFLGKNRMTYGNRQFKRNP